MAGCPLTLAIPSQPAGGHRTGILSLMPVPALVGQVRIHVR